MIAKEIAAEGMILLKNDSLLPLDKNKKISVLGGEELLGGGGSARVRCEDSKTLIGVLREMYLIDENSDTAVFLYKRYGREGADRSLGEKPDYNEFAAYMGETDDGAEENERIDCFYPTKAELTKLCELENSKVENIILVLNTPFGCDLSFIDNFSKIKAVILEFFPGMSGGEALADILYGRTCPSGKLVDTIAYKYEDYPSSENFDTDEQTTEYKEGIFVGYRYFETFAEDKVMFPFGFGLSYTGFDFSNYTFAEEEKSVLISVDVKNTGKFSGKEVVQIYVSKPETAVQRPSLELKGYAKTKELAPGEVQRIPLRIEKSSLAYFDTDRAAWVIEAGKYLFYAGNSVRNTRLCGEFNCEKDIITEQVSLKFDGKFTPASSYKSAGELSETIGKMTDDELISLAHGQPPAFPTGTGGIGNLAKYGIPNAQTADGPAGIRMSVNAACFPCGTLAACTWNADLQTAFGAALGKEGIHAGVDIILAPSMNIHRNPLCGRNFEYLSEDPLITGKTAAAIVKGIQSSGACATVKHFATNNCEFFRGCNNSVVNERTLREIYLKGFEIAIKEAKPAFVMTSYNLLNGTHLSENAPLLRGILRGEWGFEGAVMTDWRTRTNLDDEILGGNNVKMPFGYPDQAKIAMESLKSGKLTRAALEENAYYVIKAVMRTKRFKDKNFGKTHYLKNGECVIPALEFLGVSTTRVRQDKREDGKDYIFCLGKDQRSQRSFVLYRVTVDESGEYELTAEISTNCPSSQLWYYNENGERTGTALCGAAEDETKWYDIKTKVDLNKGENIIKLVFATEPDTEYSLAEYGRSWLDVTEEDIKLSGITVRRSI